MVRHRRTLSETPLYDGPGEVMCWQRAAAKQDNRGVEFADHVVCVAPEGCACSRLLPNLKKNAL